MSFKLLSECLSIRCLTKNPVENREKISKEENGEISKEEDREISKEENGKISKGLKRENSDN